MLMSRVEPVFPLVSVDDMAGFSLFHCPVL
jgi:hypothetical protein